MADLEEQPVWHDGIFQIEKETIAMGGPGGVSNLQAKQLADRTQFLRVEVDGANARLGILEERWGLVQRVRVAFDADATITETPDHPSEPVFAHAGPTLLVPDVEIGDWLTLSVRVLIAPGSVLPPGEVGEIGATWFAPGTSGSVGGLVVGDVHHAKQRVLVSTMTVVATVAGQHSFRLAGRIAEGGEFVIAAGSTLQVDVHRP